MNNKQIHLINDMTEYGKVDSVPITVVSYLIDSNKDNIDKNRGRFLKSLLHII